MKLELNSKEVEAVLLAYAEREWPGKFNRVEGERYSGLPSVTFTFLEPKEREEVE